MHDKCKQPFGIKNALDSKGLATGRPSSKPLALSRNNKGSGANKPGPGESSGAHALGVLTKPIDIKRTQEQRLSRTPDSAVLDRMVELESAIATVKSSLDNQASSYYSVASQIAELNARIQHLSVSDRRAASSNNDDTSRTILSTASFKASASASSLSSGSCVDRDSVTPLLSDTASLQKTVSENAAMSDKDGSDEHYTRIQEMIDSLIKDADSALNSKPARHHHHQQQQSSVHSDDSTDLQLSCDPLCSPEQLSSVSTVFDDAPPAYLSPSFSRRPATRHAASSYKTPEIYPKRPMSAMSMSSKSSRSRRYRPQTPVSKPRVLDTDPSEADAESDTELGSINASGSRPKSSYNVNGGRSHGRRQEASVNSSDLYAHINYSARHAFSSQQHQPQHNRHMYSRYRSDTLDSFMSNSSETCVSPGNRYSREFYRAPATSQTYTGAGVLVDSLCTPTRRGFNFDFNSTAECDDEALLDASLGSRETSGASTSQKHDFPHLYNDQHTFDQHRQPPQQQQRQQVRANPDAHSSALAGSNVPLIRRVRNSFARAVLRSASLVDDSINDDIAALPSDPRWSAESPSSRVLRHRSNTVDSDYSPSPESAMRNDSYRESSAQNSIFNHQARFVDDRDCYSSLPSHLHPPNSGSGPMPGSPSGLWSRRRGENNSGYEASHNHLPSSHNAKYQSDSLGSNVRSDRECQLSALRIDTSNVDGSQIRRPDSIEEYDSSSGVASISALSSGRELVGCTSPASASSSNSDESASGLFGIISLFYWTLLFTLGALMLDSFLCQVAGKRVMGTVDKIAQSENLIDSPNSKNKGKGSRSKNLTISHSNNADTKSNADVANTVGRFVRWYIEGPDEWPRSQASSSSSSPASFTKQNGSRESRRLGVDTDKPQTHSQRSRKPSAMRGSFKHVE
ncbi:hypothetical protein GGF40_002139 [Coemansia sp. RSA 1286]|nr:hypothetical protein GGF39_002531 [Coemansia sp. RSA 1721]KAJ2637754.1 hypothetical protein GGF40_002139 [Coemansia sp. RSA 1286]